MRKAFWLRLACTLPLVMFTACSMYINVPKIAASNADPSFSREIRSIAILSNVADPARGPGFGETLSRGYQEAAARCNVSATVIEAGAVGAQGTNQNPGQVDAVLSVLRASVVQQTISGVAGAAGRPFPVEANYQVTLSDRASRREVWKAELKVAYQNASGPRAAEAGDVADVIFRRLAQDGILRNCSFPPKR
jgi:hypothetical protein